MLTITLPMPPNIGNGRMARQVQHRIKRGYWATCDAIHGHDAPPDELGWLEHFARRCKQHALRTQVAHILAALEWDDAMMPPPPSPIPRALIHSRMIVGALHDDDNAMRRHKHALDWLRLRSYILDDRRGVLTWAGMPDQVVRRRSTPAITLTLTPTFI